MLSTISAALDSFLQTALSSNPLDIAWEGDAYAPQTGRPYLQIELSAYTRVPGGSGQQVVFIERGTYTISVVWPTGSGKGAALAEGDKIKALFPRALSLALAGQAPLVVQDASLAPAVSDGSWLRVPVSVSWMTSEFGA
jgi:hypothetical protein